MLPFCILAEIEASDIEKNKNEIKMTHIGEFDITFAY